MTEEKQDPQEDPRNQAGMGVDSEGFFVLKIHTSRGPREVLGFLEQAKDIAKGFFIQQHQQQEKLVRPGLNGVVDRFKNRWR